MRNDEPPRLSRRAAIVGALGAGVAAPRGRPARAQTPLPVALALPTLASPLDRHLAGMATLAAANLPAIALTILDGQENGAASAQVQATAISAALEAGAVGLIVRPTDSLQVRDAVLEFSTAGLPVITLGGDLPGVTPVARVAVDNVRGGELQGELVRTRLPEGGVVFEIQGESGNSVALARHAGVRRALSGASGITVAASLAGGFTWSRAAVIFDAALQIHGVPEAVICANDAMALGVAHIAMERDYDLIIVGFGAGPAALLAIEQEALAATIEQFSGRQATMAVDILAAVLAGRPAPDPATTLVAPALVTAATLTQAERWTEVAGLNTTDDGAPASPAAGTPAGAPAGTPAGTPVGTPAATPAGPLRGTPPASPAATAGRDRGRMTKG